MYPFCDLYFMFICVMLSFIAALRSLAGKGLTSWLAFSCVLSLSNSVKGKVWYLIVLIPDLCLSLYFS